MNQVSTQTVAVAAINSGTVIDHITAGCGMKIAHFLQLVKDNKRVFLGLNLTSSRLGLKDLIKVEDKWLTPQEIGHIAVLAPDVTINVIENYRVIEKFPLEIPEVIEAIVRCPNSNCISNREEVTSRFYLSHMTKSQRKIACHYCRRVLSMEEIS